MGRLLRRWALVAMAAAGIAAVPTGARAEEVTGFDARATYRVPTEGAPSRGPDDALVTIVEFSDFHCQFCRVASETVAEIMRLYPRDVRLVYRHSLLDPDEATLAAEASLAAAEQGRFWPFHDRVFGAGSALDRVSLEGYAREVGLDLARFRRSLDDARFRSAVRAEDRRAAELGVSATPVFFVNGRPLVGAQALGTFLALVDEERAEAEALVAGGVARPDVYARVTGGGLKTAGPVFPGPEAPRIPLLDRTATHAVGLGEPSHRLGSDQALVTVVEFADFRCGFCAQTLPVLADLRAEYGDDLRLVYRHLPLGNDPESGFLAEVALAAGEQGKFWEMHGRLYAVRGQLDRASVEALAAELSLDLARFRDALDRRRFAPTVSRDGADAARLGVRGTPTFFINGSPVVGARSVDVFRETIERELARARALVKRGVLRRDVYRTATGAE